MESDLTSFDIFDIKKLSQSQIEELQKLYEKLSNIDFPSIKEQYITDNQYRRLLDTKLLEIKDYRF